MSSYKHDCSFLKSVCQCVPALCAPDLVLLQIGRICTRLRAIFIWAAREKNMFKKKKKSNFSLVNNMIFRALLGVFWQWHLRKSYVFPYLISSIFGVCSGFELGSCRFLISVDSRRLNFNSWSTGPSPSSSKAHADILKKLCSSRICFLCSAAGVLGLWPPCTHQHCDQVTSRSQVEK